MVLCSLLASLSRSSFSYLGKVRAGYEDCTDILKPLYSVTKVLVLLLEVHDQNVVLQSFRKLGHEVLDHSAVMLALALQTLIVLL